MMETLASSLNSNNSNLHDGDDLLHLLFTQLTGPLGQRNVSLLQNDVGVSPSNTFDRGQSEHNVGLSLNVGVENTENVLEVRRHNKRHDGA